MRPKPKLLIFTRYGELGASSRLRISQYLPVLRLEGWQFEVRPLFDDLVLSRRYLVGRYGFWTVLKCLSDRILSFIKIKRINLVWIEKEAMPWLPFWFEFALIKGAPYVLDYDDAVFHTYDRHPLGLVRCLYGKKLDRLMARAALVVCGNEYLADRARQAGAPRVEVIPTVIDLKKYPYRSAIKRAANRPVRIAWIGSPSTARYLDILHEPLQALSLRVPFVLRVIGANVDFPGVNVECVRWTEATEVANIVECAVGVMPLWDSAWERGKCGYKLIQYMACGLPVVASPVGVNTEIVEDGLNGYLAWSAEDWLVALERLLINAELNNRMGLEGRKRVEDKYCLQMTAPRIVELLKRVSMAVE